MSIKQKNDTRYNITTFIDNKDIHTYNSLKNQIDIHGCFIANHVKIYTPQLALFFIQNEIQAVNLDTQKNENINTYEYLKTYIEAYKEGEQYFENEFKVSPNIIYGENAKPYIEDLKIKYSGVKKVGETRGWKFVKETYPTIISHEQIKKIGYYSGVVNKFEEQVNKYPQLFKNFDAENYFDCNRPLKNYELFYKQYEAFFINIAHNNIREFYNNCDNLKKIEINDISYRAKQEVEQQLNIQNNNAERLIKRLQTETTKLIELRKEVYNTHKINNAQTNDWNNLLGAFRFVTIGLNEFLDAILPLIENDNSESQPPQQDAPQKPELTGKLITFNSNETIEKLHTELKGYFSNKEAELLKALQGEKLTELLLFPHNQNKFVEVFKRVKYNGYLANTPKEINNWICLNFTYAKTKGNKKTVENFNESTIKTILTNTTKERQAEPTPKERICTPDWLPHYWNNQLKNE